MTDSCRQKLSGSFELRYEIIHVHGSSTFLVEATVNEDFLDFFFDTKVVRDNLKATVTQLYYNYINIANDETPTILCSDAWVWKFFSRAVYTAVCLNAALRVWFFLKKPIRTRPSHSRKLIGGGGFFGSILTTLDSTFGGGRKLFLPTCGQINNKNQSTQMN